MAKPAQAKMQITYVSIDSIKPYPENARRHSDEQIKALVNSLRTFGFKRPIGIDEDRVIVTGHGLHRAARKAGYKEVPTVDMAGLTPEEVRAFRLADNRLAEMSDWDYAMMRKELSELGDMLLDYGFTDIELQTADIDDGHVAATGDEPWGGDPNDPITPARGHRVTVVCPDAEWQQKVIEAVKALPHEMGSRDQNPPRQNIYVPRALSSEE